MIASSLSNVVRGRNLSPFQTDYGEVDLWIGFREQDRQNLDQVMNIMVEGSGGQRATVRQLVDVGYSTSLQSIRRENGMTRVVVTAISQDRNLLSLGATIRELMEGFQMPHGLPVVALGPVRRDAGTKRTSMNFAIIMAVAFVFLLMGILFESFVLPLSRCCWRFRSASWASTGCSTSPDRPST